MVWDEYKDVGACLALMFFIAGICFTCFVSSIVYEEAKIVTILFGITIVVFVFWGICYWWKLEEVKKNEWGKDKK